MFIISVTHASFYLSNYHSSFITSRTFSNQVCVPNLEDSWFSWSEVCLRVEKHCTSYQLKLCLQLLVFYDSLFLAIQTFLHKQVKSQCRCGKERSKTLDMMIGQVFTCFAYAVVLDFNTCFFESFIEVIMWVFPPLSFCHGLLHSLTLNVKSSLHSWEKSLLVLVCNVNYIYKCLYKYTDVAEFSLLVFCWVFCVSVFISQVDL